MLPRTSTWLMGSALTLCGACSLHSLEYLSAGASDAEGGQASGGQGISGDQSAAGSDMGGGGGSAAGSTAGGGNAGASGAPPEIPDCTDGERTVDETDVDCGGRTCAPCADDERCLAGTDCASAICTNQVCQPPTCSDLAVNGDETDLNCGGACPKCTEGKRCSAAADCATGRCELAVCASATCSDEVLQDGCALLVDSTPYTLSPRHAPTKCIDDSGRSVVDGNGMVLYACNAEPHQAFWAVAKGDGYFAFRNALSGKCLQVRGQSTDEDAVIEQWSCDYSPAQLWKPARVDDEYMTLTPNPSGLVLDVSGSNVGTDSQPIVQGQPTNAADTHWRLQRRTAGAYIALSPNADKALHVGHDEAFTVVTAEDDDESSHWRVVSGLNDARGVSFQSRDDPGRYLRHTSFRIWSDKNDGSTLFARDATFRYVDAFVGASSRTRAIESMSYQGWFLRRSGDAIYLEQFVDTPEFRAAATWWIGAR